MRVYLVAPPPTISGGQVGDLFAIAVLVVGENSPTASQGAGVTLAGDCINIGALKRCSGRVGCRTGLR